MKTWMPCKSCTEVMTMIFHEVYSCYYNAVAAILSKAVEGELTDREITRLAEEKAFSESVLTIPAALKDGSWPFLTDDLQTPLRNKPTMPLTTLQKRGLKTLLGDPRIRLFAIDDEGLKDIEPLCSPDDFVYFDRYTDGDPFEDEGYIERFRILLAALREQRKVIVEFTGRMGKLHRWVCVPHKLEYSQKDDKFRLITLSPNGMPAINLARISKCELTDEPICEESAVRPINQERLELELVDERNALERVMLHFSHFEKETKRLDDKRYQLILRYDKDDETELLIRVLSFGPMLKVLSPEDFKEKLIERLKKQQKLRAQE